MMGIGVPFLKLLFLFDIINVLICISFMGNRRHNENRYLEVRVAFTREMGKMETKSPLLAL